MLNILFFSCFLFPVFPWVKYQLKYIDIIIQFCMSLHCIVWYCTVWHCTVWYCTRGVQNTQLWKFQDATKNCGYATSENPKTVFVQSLALKLTFCIAFQFLGPCSKKNGSKWSKKCTFSDLAYYSSKSGKRIKQKPIPPF